MRFWVSDFIERPRVGGEGGLVSARDLDSCDSWLLGNRVSPDWVAWHAGWQCAKFSSVGRAPWCRRACMKRV